MNRIQRASKGVKLLAHALFWISLIGGVMGIYAAYDQHGAVRWIAAYLSVATVVMAGMCRHTARLAELYERGLLFTAENVRHLAWIGRLALLTSVAPTLEPDDGAQALAVGVEVHPAVIVVSLLLIFVSWVIDEARKLEDEQALVI